MMGMAIILEKYGWFDQKWNDIIFFFVYSFIYYSMYVYIYIYYIYLFISIYIYLRISDQFPSV